MHGQKNIKLGRMVYFITTLAFQSAMQFRNSLRNPPLGTEWNEIGSRNSYVRV